MLTEHEIREKFETIGLPPEEVSALMADVAQVILEKTLHAYIDTLPEETRAEFRALSDADISSYLASHPDLPPFSQYEFERIHDEVWRDYFASTVE